MAKDGDDVAAEPSEMLPEESQRAREAAEVLECKVGTARSRVSRARADLSDVLGLGDVTDTDALA